MKEFINPATAERFWSKVGVRGGDERWPWLAGRDRAGYGSFSVTVSPGHDKKVRAPHVSLLLGGHSRPDGLCALHSCDNPPCCNPDHLRWGTAKDNAEDRDRRGHWCGGSPGLPGEMNGRAKLTPEKVIEIRSRDETSTALGRIYGVSNVAITKIRNRVTWRHI